MNGLSSTQALPVLRLAGPAVARVVAVRTRPQSPVLDGVHRAQATVGEQALHGQGLGGVHALVGHGREPAGHPFGRRHGPHFLHRGGNRLLHQHVGAGPHGIDAHGGVQGNPRGHEAEVDPVPQARQHPGVVGEESAAQALQVRALLGLLVLVDDRGADDAHVSGLHLGHQIAIVSGAEAGHADDARACHGTAPILHLMARRRSERGELQLVGPARAVLRVQVVERFGDLDRIHHHLGPFPRQWQGARAG